MYGIQLNYGTVTAPDWRWLSKIYPTLDEAIKTRDFYFSNTNTSAVRIVKITEGETS